MKIPFSLAACLVIACATPAWSEEKELSTRVEDDVSLPDKDAPRMIGTYVGAFGERKITVSIDKIVGTTLSGYSVVAGNERAFSGSITRMGADYAVVAREPGDHPADGIFRFTWMAKDRTLLGSWEANDRKIGTRQFQLSYRKFRYDPKAGLHPTTSTRRLTTEEVENLRPAELRLMRNEIYARHGYSFKLADMREHFDKLDWYMPVSSDITSQLTAIEKANAELIKRYEKYTEEHYDSFGR